MRIARMRFAVLAIAGLSMYASAEAATIKKAPYGKMPDGTAIYAFTLSNAAGMQATIINYGGIVVSLKVADRNGAMSDVVLGHDSLADYQADRKTYFGALIGRYGNRIGNAQFKLDGKTYHLAKNDGNNSLHGGTEGFNRRVWTPRELPDGALELTYLSKDGEEGYPGNLKSTVVYRLNAGNTLRIEYSATTDKDTVLNLTNHTYFNLHGNGQGDILHHLVELNANQFTPIDAGLIPTGELRSVAGTPFDFRKPMAPAAHINSNDEQVKLGKGYDMNFVINHVAGGGLTRAARVTDPQSGRVLEVWTDQPGVQFYTGNFLDGSAKGKGGNVYPQHAGLCLETQHFPDSPNKPSFPSTELKPGQTYKTATEWRFSTARGK
jgi:aldose 1-epimerase